ncbi:Na+/H+ antiporter NhaC family protein [Halomonas colorata]|uniref:Na+/H+ antiporter NhaC family protein n=1 Tax=Halomonas colorata TaxID=2742615 RepID=UPI001865FDE9|nr:Na+/H+ antiporter NhaC family protein [Halomonas colorata]
MQDAKKVKSDPTRSIVHDLPIKFEEVETLNSNMSPALKRAAIVFLGMFAFLIYGSINLGFSFSQMSATFIAMAIFVGLAYGAGPNRICHMFSRGMSEMMIAAMVIFFARSILFVMDESQVIDTVINYLAGLIGGVSGQAGATLILLVQTTINFLIPSGSGQAAITMPIIIPLSDIMEVNRQVAILASQLGDGMSNFIFPTNGALIAILSVAGIPYLKWLRFFGPLYLILFSTAITLVSIASMIGYGPF